VQPGSDAEDEVAGDALRRRLDRLVEVERIHLDPELSFATFVQRMGAPERVVRKLVNHQLGFDHFRSFLIHYRVREARRLLADPHRSGDKLIAIAFDSGFASLASFNRVFRDAEASTPSAYRDAALAARSAADRGGAGEKSSGGTGFEERSAVF
jgi:AraC-like DNA-binding protein